MLNYNSMSETKQIVKSPRSNIGRRSRTKGHNYEREITTFFKKLGYVANTTRRASRLMDDAKLDIHGIPYNVQCKNVKVPMNYHSELKAIKEKVIELIPERKDLPIFIFHKKDRKTLIITDLDEFIKLDAFIKAQSKK